ncbi:MAG: HAMP domain-containing protein [Blastochloris sp.]|nr:HAMP domain-containing protein [Blastochloris sp.]
MDFVRAELDTNEPYIRHPSQDLTSIWFTTAILEGQIDSWGDKFAGLVQFGDSDTIYVASVAPVQVDTEVVGGVIAAVRLDRLLANAATQSQAAGILFYDTDGRLIDSSFALTSGGSRADYAVWPEQAALPPLNVDAIPELPESDGVITPRMLTPTMEPPSSVRILETTTPDTVSTLQRMDPVLLARSKTASDFTSAPLFAILDINNRSYQASYTPFTLRQTSVGVLAVLLARDYMLVSVGDSFIPVITLSVLIGMFVMTLGMFITRQVVQPVEQLMRTARSVSSGDLTARSMVRSSDEIGALSSSFNQMTEYLATLYSQVQAEASQRAAIVESLGDGVVVCEPDGRVLLVNRAGRRLINLGDADPLPVQLSDIPLKRVETSPPGIPVGISTDLYTLHERLVRASVAPIVDPTGSNTGYVTLIHDVTTELALEARVSTLTRANEAVYQALAQGLGVEDIASLATYTRPRSPR